MNLVSLLAPRVRIMRRLTEEGVPSVEGCLRIDRRQQLLHGSFEAGVEKCHPAAWPAHRYPGCPQVPVQLPEPADRVCLGYPGCDSTEAVDLWERAPEVALQILQRVLHQRSREHDIRDVLSG